jgi:hypothetical protein
MADGTVHIALFNEDQVDEAAEAISRLRSLGITDNNISVISGVPLSENILGRPMTWTRVPIIAGVGAVIGFLVAAALVFGTQVFYPIRAGSMPNAPIPTAIVVLFELTMLGMLISTFIGVFIETISPSYGPRGYDPRITDGHIGILFTSPTRLDDDIHSRLGELGAELVHRAEVKKLWL